MKEGRNNTIRRRKAIVGKGKRKEEEKEETMKGRSEK